MPARGPRREDATDGDAALGRGSGREAPAEPPRPLEGEARLCVAEVGRDWDRGAAQGRRGAFCGHRHGQCRKPAGAETEAECGAVGPLKLHLACGPRESCSYSCPHSPHVLLSTPRLRGPCTVASKGMGQAFPSLPQSHGPEGLAVQEGAQNQAGSSQMPAQTAPAWHSQLLPASSAQPVRDPEMEMVTRPSGTTAWSPKYSSFLLQCGAKAQPVRALS